MQRPRIIIASIAVAVAAAGGITAAVASTSTASAAAAPASPSASASTATVRTLSVPVGGRMETILVTAAGQPLYYYQPDTAGKSLVTGELAVQWPPLIASAPTGAGLSGQLGQLSSGNGPVTYNGHPLYTFIADHAGQATGQGVQDFYLATPGLAPLGSTPVTGTSAPAAPSGSYGYGY